MWVQTVDYRAPKALVPIVTSFLLPVEYWHAITSSCETCMRVYMRDTRRTRECARHDAVHHAVYGRGGKYVPLCVREGEWVGRVPHFWMVRILMCLISVDA